MYIEVVARHDRSRYYAARTLVVLDEVQDIPEAIEALKYFYEDAPEYHTAVAGSLLFSDTEICTVCKGFDDLLHDELSSAPAYSVE